MDGASSCAKPFTQYQLNMAFPAIRSLSSSSNHLLDYSCASTKGQVLDLIMSYSSNSFRTSSLSPHHGQDYTSHDTYQIIRSSPFTEQDWAEASDADAPADEWDDAEYNRQMCGHLQKQYQVIPLMELRRVCKGRKLRVRGNKDELVLRLAEDDVRKMYGRGE